MSEQVDKALASKEAAVAKASGLGLVDSKSLAVGGAGQGGGLGLNKPGFTEVKSFVAKSDKKTIQIPPEVSEAWAKILDDADTAGWLFLEYSGDSKSLELKATGPGGLNAFREVLGDNVGWGAFRCAAVDRRGGVDSKRAKLIFVQYKPESASAMKKARMNSHKGDVKDVIINTHLDIAVETMDDLKETDLIVKLQAATGAHKPNGYEFEEGEFIEADFYGLGIGADCKGETATAG